MPAERRNCRAVTPQVVGMLGVAVLAAALGLDSPGAARLALLLPLLALQVAETRRRRR